MENNNYICTDVLCMKSNNEGGWYVYNFLFILQKKKTEREYKDEE